MSDEYLTMTQIAAKLGIKYRTVNMNRWRGLMPEPDMILLGRPLWLEETIDKWNANRRRGRKGSRKTRKARKARALKNRREPVKRNSLPSGARLSNTGASADALPPVAAMDADVAAKIASLLRNDGHHCTSRDVQELALANPDGLDYERRKLQQRVMRKLRGIKGS